MATTTIYETVEEYLARGGKINKMPLGKSSSKDAWKSWGQQGCSPGLSHKDRRKKAIKGATNANKTIQERKI